MTTHGASHRATLETWILKSRLLLPVPHGDSSTYGFRWSLLYRLSGYHDGEWNRLLRNGRHSCDTNNPIGKLATSPGLDLFGRKEAFTKCYWVDTEGGSDTCSPVVRFTCHSIQFQLPP